MKPKIYLAISFLLLAVLLTGCGASRKVVGTVKETAQIEEKRTETTAGEIRQLVDTTKTDGLEVTYTKIEYYPPAPEVQQPKPDTTATADTLAAGKKAPKPRPKEPKEKQPPDAGSKQGAIKSIETYTVKHKTEAAGVTQTEQKEETAKTEEVSTDSDTETDVTEQPAADPYRWRYIFGILVLLAVGIILLRKSKVFTAVAAFFRRLF